MRITRPTADEHAPYHLTYIDAAAAAMTAAGSGDIVALLASQPAAFRALLHDAPPSAAGFAYAPGKWTLAESLVHVNDTERVFS